MILLIINLLLLFLGCIMEGLAIMILLVPVLLPVTQAVGIDPVHFGVVVVMNLMIGILTPPFGVALFVVAKVGNIPFHVLARAILPFLGPLIVVQVIVHVLARADPLPAAPVLRLTGAGSRSARAAPVGLRSRPREGDARGRRQAARVDAAVRSRHCLDRPPNGPRILTVMDRLVSDRAGAEPWAWSAARLAAAIARKELSPVEAVEAVLARIDRVNGPLNAFVTVTAELARAEARRAEAAVMRGGPLGRLHGVPFSVKDTLDTAGVRTTMGAVRLADRVPTEDAAWWSLASGRPARSSSGRPRRPSSRTRA